MVTVVCEIVQLHDKRGTNSISVRFLQVNTQFYTHTEVTDSRILPNLSQFVTPLGTDAHLVQFLCHNWYLTVKTASTCLPLRRLYNNTPENDKSLRCPPKVPFCRMFQIISWYVATQWRIPSGKWAGVH